MPIENEQPIQGPDEADSPLSPTTSDRPDWLKDKFQTSEEQAKAYADLEKIHGKINNEHSKVKDYFGAPEKGYEVPEEISKKLNEVGQGVLDKFNEFSKDNNFSQKLHHELVNFVAQWEATKVNDAAVEITKLYNGITRYNDLMDWLKGSFGPDDIASLKMPITTGNIQFLEKMRENMSGQSNIPSNNATQNSVPAGNGRTAEEMQQELGSGNNLERFKTDKFYQKDFIERTHKRVEGEMGKR